MKRKVRKSLKMKRRKNNLMAMMKNIRKRKSQLRNQKEERKENKDDVYTHNHQKYNLRT